MDLYDAQTPVDPFAQPAPEPVSTKVPRAKSDKPRRKPRPKLEPRIVRAVFGAADELEARPQQDRDVLAALFGVEKDDLRSLVVEILSGRKPDIAVVATLLDLAEQAKTDPMGAFVTSLGLYGTTDTPSASFREIYGRAQSLGADLTPTIPKVTIKAVEALARAAASLPASALDSLRRQRELADEF